MKGRGKKLALILVGLGLLIGLCVAVIVLFFSPPPPPEEEANPAWSPDGKHLAVECYLSGPTKGVADSDQRVFSPDAADICVVDADGSHQVRLTTDEVEDTAPTWSPDGTRIAYIHGRDIFVINPDGSNQRQVAHVPAKAGSYDIPEGVTWSPDGKHLAFSACIETQDRDIYVADVQDGNLIDLTADNLATDMTPMWLPDGKQIAFLSSSLAANDNKDCTPNHFEVASRLKLTSVDRTGERNLDREAYHGFVAMSSKGEIAFIGNLQAQSNVATTYLYTIRPGEVEPTVWGKAYGACTWSPDGEYLACTDGDILDKKTGTRRRFPSTLMADTPFNWSPDGRNLATTGRRPEYSIGAKTIMILDLDSNTVRPLIPRKE